MKSIMKIFLAFFLTIFISSHAFSENVSEILSNLIPGEGLTEGSIQINEDDNPDLEILAVRDISANEMSNLFTQFSLHTQEINNDDRLITNVGLGYRVLNADKSIMTGVNSFIDYDLEGHTRGSLGLELKASLIDFTANSYHKITNMEIKSPEFSDFLKTVEL